MRVEFGKIERDLDDKMVAIIVDDEKVAWIQRHIYGDRWEVHNNCDRVDDATDEIQRRLCAVAFYVAAIDFDTLAEAKREVKRALRGGERETKAKGIGKTVADIFANGAERFADVEKELVARGIAFNKGTVQSIISRLRKAK